MDKRDAITIANEYSEVLNNKYEDEPRRFIQVIYGPRHVGKTTLVRQILEDLDFIGGKVMMRWIM